MKILFLIHSLTMGGAERVIATLADYWSGHGHDVVVATLAGKDRDFYSLSPKVKRVSLRLEKKSRTLTEGVANNFLRISRLRKFLLEEKPDIAIAAMTTANSLLALAGQRAGAVLIGSEHTYPPMAPIHPLWRLMRKFNYGLLDAVVAPAEESAGWIRKNTWARRAVAIPNPVVYPLPAHSPKVMPDLSLLQKKLVLAVGRLVPLKGFDVLLRAFAQLKGFSDWKLVIAGSGPEELRLKDLAAALSLEDRTVFLGRVGNLHHWYEVSDVYVLSSRYEGFSNTLVEAMSYGLAIVSTDCKVGPREIVRHGVDGLLVPTDSTASLREALSKLMSDEALRKRLSKNALAARNRFSLEKISRKWESLFSSLVS